jgi:hypothetical protein
VLGLAAILGKTIGYTAIDQRFTPLSLIKVWEGRQRPKSK